MTLIWIGALIMALGGALSLSDRRLRRGVASRAVKPSKAGKASRPANPLPAE